MAGLPQARRQWLLVGLLALAGPAWGQAATDSLGHQKVSTYREQMPVFPGGPVGETMAAQAQRLQKFLRDSLLLPASVQRDNLRGRILADFAVTAEGRTTAIALRQGLRADADSAVLGSVRRLLRLRWQPGLQNGRPVTVRFTMPFTIGSPALVSPDSLDYAPPRKVALAIDWEADRRLTPPDRGLVYGNCVQRLPGFSSGGLPQTVQLVNLSTGRAVTIQVKPQMRSRAVSTFCYALPPGRYALATYAYGDSKWYGAVQYTEPLRKPAAPAGLHQPLRATRYLFTVLPGQLHYVGTWHLEQQGQPVFRNDKAELDAWLGKYYKYLNFAAARVAVPE